MGKPGNALPGVSYLLPRGLVKEAAGVVVHSRGARAGTPAGSKGTTTVGPGINAFLPATSAPGTGVASDGSLGTGIVSYSGGKYAIPASAGTQVGGNLFESFSQFNLLEGEIADFQGPSSVQNILARVTGGSASSIDGTIESDIQGANLFLINPAGVMFGPNASLNVGGAFTVSTADYVKLADGGKFNASRSANDTSLTAGPVSAFGFLSSTPAPVSFSGSQLSVPVGTGLNVIAGNVTLASPSGDSTTPGATLSAPSGGLTVFSAASTGEVPFGLTAPGAIFELASVSALGSVSLNNGSSIAIDSQQGGGQLTIGGALVAVGQSSTVSSINEGANAGGDIQIEAGTLDVTGGGRIESEAAGSGAGGALTIQANEVTVDGDDGSRYSSIRSNAGDLSDSISTGNAGPLTVTATDITLTNGGDINGTTFSAGNGATVTLNLTGDLAISGETALSTSGVYCNVHSGATGTAGDVLITVAGLVTIDAGGEIDEDTNSSSNGGDATINAGSMTIDGSAAPTDLTGIFVSSDLGATGNAGHLTVNVQGLLEVLGAGDISGATASSGAGGDVTVNAGSITIDGAAASSQFTGIGATSNFGATGDAGNLTVNVDGLLQIMGGGKISVSTLSSGKGGDLTVQAASMTIDGSATPGLLTGVVDTSDQGNSGDSGGAAGDLNVSVSGALTILGGGEIQGDTFSSGNGGKVIVKAGSLDINGVADENDFTGISAGSNQGATGSAGDLTVNVTGAVTILATGEIATSTFSSGNGGNLTVQAGSMTINGAATTNGDATGILAESDQGNPGDTGGSGGFLHITVTRGLTLEAGGEVSTNTSTGGNAGELTVHAGSLSVIGGPNISTNISSNTYGAGNAGDVTVRAGSILVDGQSDDIYDATTETFTYTSAYISADTEGNATGAGGRVTIDAGRLIVRGGGEIDTDTFDNNNAGDLSVTAGSVSIIGDPNGDTYISSDSESGGKAGDVTISAGSILIDGDGESENTDTYISAEADGTGAGGKIKIDAGSLVLRGGGEIDTDTYDNDNAGDLTVNAGSLSIIGDPNYATYISSDTDAGGNAGDVTISTKSLLIDGRGYDTFTEISAEADSDATGAGGKVTIDAGNVVLRGGGQIDTDTNDNENAGDLTVNAGSLSIFGDRNYNTYISSDTYAGGNAGDVTVTAGSILLNGENFDPFTGIAAQSESGATGAGGDIIIDAASLYIENGAQIGAETFTSGKSGNVYLTAQNVFISGFSNAPSGIFATSQDTTSGGAAGGISIQCENLTLSAGGEISTYAVAASAGDITINVQQNVTMEGQTYISCSAEVSGGDINIRAGGLLYMLDSNITAAAGSSRVNGKETNPNAGNGGDITIDPEFIVLNDSVISANAAIGQGGNIVLQSNYYLNSGSEITATGATSGTITISSPELDLSGALIGLPEGLVDEESQLQETCATAINGDVSSFLAVGQGDVEVAPDEAQGGSGDMARPEQSNGRHKTLLHP